MLRMTLAAASLAAATAVSPLWADEIGKEDSCKFQGQVMAAVQQARMDRVAQDKVAETILSANPNWPPQFSNTIDPLTAHVYGMKRRDLRKVDLGAVLEQQCLDNWDQIQEMQHSLSSDE